MGNEIRKKYVIINKAFPVIFAEAIPHVNMSKIGNITSAGFVDIKPSGDGIEVQTYGESEGLGIKARPDDAQIIKVILKL